MTKPFRWDITRREQLGQLVEGKPILPFDNFISELRECCTRIVASCDNADLVFIGRSPENLFDYLSGIFASTNWVDRCTLVNISIRFEFISGAIEEGRRLLEDYDLSPEKVMKRPRSVALIDLVASGTTFGNIASLLSDWAEDCHVDPAAFRKKLRFVGITMRTQTSPKTWRWQQHAAWAKNFSPSQIKNVSIPSELWDYLGNDQPKVSRWNPPSQWGSDNLLSPGHEPSQLTALQLALYLFDTGNSSEEQLAFAMCLAREPAMRQRWYRALIAELRKMT
jgi:hypothetical protein